MKPHEIKAFKEGVRIGKAQVKALSGNRRLTRFLKETDKINKDDMAWKGKVGNCYHMFDIATFNEMLGQMDNSEQKKFEGTLAHLDMINAPREEFLKMIAWYMQAMIDAQIFDLPCF